MTRPEPGSIDGWITIEPSYVVLIIAIAILITVKFHEQWSSWIQRRRRKHIDNYVYPDAVRYKLKERYPHLNAKQIQQVLDGLSEFFHLCHDARDINVSMPSQAVDIAWHEFIVCTDEYRRFCRKAFGFFLHHTPAEAMSSPIQAENGIRRSWGIACLRDYINPEAPDRLPMLFALDAELNIEDGFHYSLDCGHGEDTTEHGLPIYCAAHIGCSAELRVRSEPGAYWGNPPDNGNPPY